MPQREIKDDHLHQGMRRKLITELRGKGIRNETVLSAMDKVPRHLFIHDTAFLRMAYADVAFPIGQGQTISQPYTVAVQSDLLALRPGERVLEIGTGSGYQTAVLCEMGAKVTSIERHRPLHIRTKALLESLGYRANQIYGDGYKGAPSYGPFDAVIITCGAPGPPPALLDQMKPGGRMIVPVGEGEDQVMVKLVRAMDGTFSSTEHGLFRFVPMLENKVEG